MTYLLTCRVLGLALVFGRTGDSFLYTVVVRHVPLLKREIEGKCTIAGPPRL